MSSARVRRACISVKRTGASRLSRWSFSFMASVVHSLLPDILSYDPRRPVSFPHNGRTLTDDVADVFFSMYANRDVTDKVGPHRDLLDEFPYLGPPHSIESKPNESKATYE